MNVNVVEFPSQMYSFADDEPTGVGLTVISEMKVVPAHPKADVGVMVYLSTPLILLPELARV